MAGEEACFDGILESTQTFFGLLFAIALQYLKPLYAKQHATTK